MKAIDGATSDPKVTSALGLSVSIGEQRPLYPATTQPPSTWIT